MKTIIEDCVRPEYKGFKNSFYAKAIRVLGYNPLDSSPEVEEIKKTIDGVIEKQMHPQYAYERLLRLKKEPKTSEVSKE